VTLAFFLFQVFVISLSGVMAPGPVTAAAVAMGQRSKYAGAFITLGHAIVEFPLMIAIMLGIGKLLQSQNTQMIISFAGGVLLLVMATRMLADLSTASEPQNNPAKAGAVWAGLVLSAGNPYFLIWWATVGLTFATRAMRSGIWVFAMFVIIHLLCDCIWLTALSWASFRGSNLLGDRGRRIVLLICSTALFVFGLIFIYNAVDILSS